MTFNCSKFLLRIFTAESVRTCTSDSLSYSQVAQKIAAEQTTPNNIKTMISRKKRLTGISTKACSKTFVSENCTCVSYNINKCTSSIPVYETLELFSQLKSDSDNSSPNISFVKRIESNGWHASVVYVDLYENMTAKHVLCFLVKTTLSWVPRSVVLKYFTVVHTVV